MNTLDPVLLLTASLSGLIVYAIYRKIMRADGPIGFILHVRERESCGEDLILFALMLSFVMATFVFVSAAFNFGFVKAEWFIAIRRELTALIWFVLAIHFLNGRISRFVARLVRYAPK